jgi:hypothetical protein
VGGTPVTVPVQDLSGDKLIQIAPRAQFNEKQVPSRNGN